MKSSFAPALRTMTTVNGGRQGLEGCGGVGVGAPLLWKVSKLARAAVSSRAAISSRRRETRAAISSARHDVATALRCRLRKFTLNRKLEARCLYGCVRSFFRFFPRRRKVVWRVVVTLTPTSKTVQSLRRCFRSRATCTRRGRTAGASRRFLHVVS